MLRQESIKVGGAYVNERDGVIREVVEEVDRFRVRVNEFNLRTGRLVPPVLRTAYKRQLKRWALREASAIEVASLHPGERNAMTTPREMSERRNAEQEHNRARMEQVVASNVLHRW